MPPAALVFECWPSHWRLNDSLLSVSSQWSSEAILVFRKNTRCQNWSTIKSIHRQQRKYWKKWSERNKAPANWRLQCLIVKKKCSPVCNKDERPLKRAEEDRAADTRVAHWVGHAHRKTSERTVTQTRHCRRCLKEAPCTETLTERGDRREHSKSGIQMQNFD